MEIAEFFNNIETPLAIVHVGGVVLGMGGALVADMLFSFFSKDKKLNSTEIYTLSILSKLVLYSLIVIALSGLALFLSDVGEYINSAKFLAKMSILLVLLINGYLLNKYIWPHLLNKNFFTLKKERNIRRLAFVFGAISVISWLSVFALGSLHDLAVSYSSIISIYFVIVFLGIIISLWVEKREFN